MEHIVFDCACGRTLRVKGEHAGKHTRCPGCHEPLLIPQAEGPGPKEARFQTERPPPRRRRTEEELPTVTAVEEDDLPVAEPASPPRRRRRRRRRRSSGGFDLGSLFSMDPAGGAVLGGLAMMLGAVVWFVLGLFVGVIFFYPPVLFIIGLITFFGGINGQSE